METATAYMTERIASANLGERDTDAWTAKRWLGIMAHRTGDREAAVKHLRASLLTTTNAKRLTSNRIYLGQVLLELGRTDEALAQYQDALLQSNGTLNLQAATIAWNYVARVGPGVLDPDDFLIFVRRVDAMFSFHDDTWNSLIASVRNVKDGLQ